MLEPSLQNLAKALLQSGTEARVPFEAKLREYGVFDDFYRSYEQNRREGMDQTEAYIKAAEPYGLVCQVPQNFTYRDTHAKNVQSMPRKKDVERMKELQSLSEDVWKDKPAQNPVEDQIWVYDHMAIKGLKPEQAPSKGAWGLYNWAWRNQDRFYQLVIPLIQARAARSTRESYEASTAYALIDKCLQAFEAAVTDGSYSEDLEPGPEGSDSEPEMAKAAG